MVAFDFYEFHEDGRMSAHWDAMMCDTPPNASGHGLTDNIVPINDLELTEENKAKLTAAFDVFINGTPEEAYATLQSTFHADYRQHNPDGSDGIEGFLAAQTSADIVPRWEFARLHELIGKGNYMLAISEGNHVGVHSVFYGLVRFEDGKVAGHALFVARLRGPLNGPLLCLEMQDHYLMVHHSGGSEMILCRMEDAARELNRQGLRVRRTWWVAANAVDGVERDGQRTFLRLTDDRRVPVGRSFRPDLKAAGWQ